ncbi:MAG: DUF167 domain-containing protein [Chloroflexi bacterium]|nr:DUF167 domain-containing protein [Chloroflexota bacterium]
MSAHKFQFGKGTGGSALSVKVTPRARKNEIVGVMADGTLKVRVTAPPVDNKANEAVIELLAEALNVPKSRIDIVAGETSTQKLVSVTNITPAQVEELLQKLAREDGDDEE